MRPERAEGRALAAASRWLGLPAVVRTRERDVEVSEAVGVSSSPCSKAVGDAQVTAGAAKMAANVVAASALRTVAHRTFGRDPSLFMRVSLIGAASNRSSPSTADA
jgi:hypothetical protein